jgi:hypothetical protein
MTSAQSLKRSSRVQLTVKLSQAGGYQNILQITTILIMLNVLGEGLNDTKMGSSGEAKTRRLRTLRILDSIDIMASKSDKDQLGFVKLCIERRRKSGS